MFLGEIFVSKARILPNSGAQLSDRYRIKLASNAVDFFSDVKISLKLVTLGSPAGPCH